MFVEDPQGSYDGSRGILAVTYTGRPKVILSFVPEALCSVSNWSKKRLHQR